MQPYKSTYSAYTGSAVRANAAPSSDFDELFSSQPSSSMGFGREASQTAKRPRCAECGTRKMRLRAGQLICKRGHVQQHFRVEEAEGDEYIGDGVARKRRVTKTHRVRRLKSQHTPWWSQPETDVEQDDSEQDELEQESIRAHRRASSYSARSAHTDEEDELLSDSEEADENRSTRPYSIREDSFFERPPRSTRSYAVSSAAEESGVESEHDTHARASRRGIRSIWRSGVGLHGAFEGRFALLQCLQLVLRLQLHKLREVWADKLPPETEAVARDLWAMFVSLLPVGHYPPEPMIAATFDWHTRSALSQERAAEMFPNHATYDPERDIHAHRRRMLFNSFHHHCERKARGEAVPTRPFMGEKSDVEHEAEDPVAAKECIDWILGADVEQRRRRRQRSSEPESLADPEEELAQLDPVFAEQRRQRQERARTESNAGEDTAEASGAARGKKRKRRFMPAWATKHAVSSAQKEILQLATVPTTLSIVYLALHLLKVPVFWSDLRRLVASYELPYLNVVHKLPLELTRSLNKDNVHHHLLDTDAVPSLTTLHLHTLTVAELLGRTYGVEFGEANVAGQMARLTEAMLLPPTFYVAAMRVLQIVRAGVTPELMPAREKGKGLPGAALVQRVPKEFVLTAALLIVVKMRYGLDGHERVERLPTEDGGGVSCAPALEPWLAALDARKQRFLQSRQAVEQIDPVDLDPLHMSDEQLEAYASFVERNLVLPNQIDLHEWRRLEPQRRWAAFTDFLRPTPPVPPAGPASDTAAPTWKQLEADLSALYRRNVVRPGQAEGLECGERYIMHEFAPTSNVKSEADPLGLCYSSLYPRVIHHANDAVGIQTPPTPAVAMDVLIDLQCTARTRSNDVTIKTWEEGYGIQAHLEALERMLDAETAQRAKHLRTNLAHFHPKNIPQPDIASDESEEDQVEEEEEENEGQEA